MIVAPILFPRLVFVHLFAVAAALPFSSVHSIGAMQLNSEPKSIRRGILHLEPGEHQPPDRHELDFQTDRFHHIPEFAD